MSINVVIILNIAS